MTRLKMIAAVLVTSGALPIASQAAPISHSGIASAVQSQPVVEQVAFRWAGREYCFYDDGWRGAGWYWCGYRLRSGLGWGGPTGWHGWATEGVIRERGRIGVEERGRIGVERRGVVEERGRIGVERRGVVEERGRVGAEQRGRVGVQERGGREPTTTGRGGFEGGPGARQGQPGANGGGASGGGAGRGGGTSGGGPGQR